VSAFRTLSLAKHQLVALCTLRSVLTQRNIYIAQGTARRNGSTATDYGNVTHQRNGRADVFAMVEIRHKSIFSTLRHAFVNYSVFSLFVFNVHGKQIL